MSAEASGAQQTLLDYLRGAGLTGANEGYAEGECGACAVALVKQNGSGSEYRAVNSCLMLLPMTAGQEIYTVESLADCRPGASARLHPVQEAFVEKGGSQCGYCTPGFVMSLFAEYYRPGRNGSCDIGAMGGNLCRCTGYRPIGDAALTLGPPPDDAFRSRLHQPAPPLDEFAYADGETYFSRPASLAAFQEELRANPATRFIAGGTDLVSGCQSSRCPFSTAHQPGSYSRVAYMEGNGRRGVGAAGVTLSEIGAQWVDGPPAFREWLMLFASPLIRKRATLGGNLATASPIGDAAPLLLALDAGLRLIGPGGERLTPLDILHRLPQNHTGNAERLSFRFAFPSPIRSSRGFTKWPSASWMTSAPWRRAWR